MANWHVLELAATATSEGSPAERAGWMLERLRGVVPFDAAWMALTDPIEGSYHTVAAADLDEGTQRYLSGPEMAADIETTQTHRVRPPLSPSDLPFPAQDLATWAECLIPAGFHEALAVALYSGDGRHVGFLALLSQGARPPSPVTRRRPHRVTPVLARGIDPLRALAASARLVGGARAGATLWRDGTARPLPGLTDDTLLADASPVVSVARAQLADGGVFASFLWPRGDLAAPEDHVRVAVLGSPVEVTSGLLGAVVLAPPGDLHGLTPRELQVLGLVVDGRSNQQIAHALVVTPRTVATHLEHILAKLGSPTRTVAAVRAQRQGLYVPAPATAD